MYLETAKTPTWSSIEPYSQWCTLRFLLSFHEPKVGVYRVILLHRSQCQRRQMDIARKLLLRRICRPTYLPPWGFIADNNVGMVWRLDLRLPGDRKWVLLGSPRKCPEYSESKQPKGKSPEKSHISIPGAPRIRPKAHLEWWFSLEGHNESIGKSTDGRCVALSSYWRQTRRRRRVSAQALQESKESIYFGPQDSLVRGKRVKNSFVMQNGDKESPKCGT